MPSLFPFLLAPFLPSLILSFIASLLAGLFTPIHSPSSLFLLSFPHFPASSLIHFLVSPCIPFFIAYSLLYSLPCLSPPSRFFLAPSLGRSHSRSFCLPFPHPLIYSLTQAFALLCLLSLYFRLWKVLHLVLAVESENKQRLYEQVLIFLFSETLE